jgi:hypothetical protein
MTLTFSTYSYEWLPTLVASKICVRKTPVHSCHPISDSFFEKIHQSASQENEEKPQTQDLKIAIC